MTIANSIIDSNTKINLLFNNNEGFLVIPSSFGNALKKMQAAYLQRLHYWIQKKCGLLHETVINGVRKTVRWIYNTVKEWAQQLQVSKRTMERILHDLEERGLVISAHLATRRSNRTKSYTLNYDLLEELLSSESPSTSMAESFRQNGGLYTKNTLHNNFKEKSFVEEIKEPMIEEPSQEQHNTLIEKASEEINNVLDHLECPVEKAPLLVRSTLALRMKTHFGKSKEGLERLKQYCQAYVQNDFLMGKKPMKSGDRFRTSAGSVLSPKIIEDFFSKKGVFSILARPKPEREPMSKREEIKELPPLTLEEVQAKALTPFDKSIKTSLYESIGSVPYHSWFHNTNFVAEGLGWAGEPEFSIENKFAREYILRNYGKQIMKAFKTKYE